MLSSAETENRHQTVVVEVKSEYDPTFTISCSCNDTVKTQRQTDYQIVVNGVKFQVPGVWVSICCNCEEISFSSQVGVKVMETILTTLYPEEAQLAGLSREDD
jgi:hypothetical protein